MGNLRRWTAARPTAVDAVVALLLTAAAVVAAFLTEGAASQVGDAVPPGTEGPASPGTAVTVVAMVAVTLPLAARRRYPLSCLAATVTAVLAGAAAGVPVSPVTVLAGSLASYSAAAHGRRRWVTIALGATVATLLALVAAQLAAGLPGQPLAQAFMLVVNAVVLVLPWALGSALRSLRARERQLAEQAAHLHQEREINARQAVLAERVRIARELHDVVAHHVSVMGVQAGAARRVLDRWPDRVTEALRSIEVSSRDAVAELHRLLELLRRPDDPDDPDEPGQPGLEHLDDLAGRVAAGGLAVQVAVEGDRGALADLLDVSAYRIVQEALTNTLKHAAATRVTVRVHYRADAVELAVVDDGTGVPPDTPAGGHGLIGMRERVLLHGGRLTTGPGPDGGFAVRASLPRNGAGHP